MNKQQNKTVYHSKQTNQDIIFEEDNNVMSIVESVTPCTKRYCSNPILEKHNSYNIVDFFGGNTQ